jgi:hypothetical protein
VGVAAVAAHLAVVVVLAQSSDLPRLQLFILRRRLTQWMSAQVAQVHQQVMACLVPHRTSALLFRRRQAAVAVLPEVKHKSRAAAVHRAVAAHRATAVNLAMNHLGTTVAIAMMLVLVAVAMRRQAATIAARQAAQVATEQTSQDGLLAQLRTVRQAASAVELPQEPQELAVYLETVLPQTPQVLAVMATVQVRAAQVRQASSM